MVNVNDLMVGNWVKSPKGIIQIHNILTDSIISKNEGKVGDLYRVTCVDPIPVTEEMLKKIGFEEDTTAGEPWKFWRYWGKDYHFKLDVYPDELFCNSNRKFGLHIDNEVCSTIGSGEFTYVHELMNLVKVITGLELPITKEVLV